MRRFAPAIDAQDYRWAPPLRDRWFADSPLRKTDSNLWFRISGKRFFYTASEPQTGREPHPVLTTDDGRFIVGRARLALAMISTSGHRASRRRRREASASLVQSYRGAASSCTVKSAHNLPRFS